MIAASQIKPGSRLHCTQGVQGRVSGLPFLDSAGVMLRKPPLATQTIKAEEAKEKPWTGTTPTVTQQGTMHSALKTAGLTQNQTSSHRLVQNAGAIPSEEGVAQREASAAFGPSALKTQDGSCLTSPCWGCCSLPRHSPNHTSPGPASPLWDAEETGR